LAGAKEFAFWVGRLRAPLKGSEMGRKGVDRTSVMVIGHADKIRMQVRSIGSDGKIWINRDSFLLTTLIGHEVLLFSRDPRKAGQ
jgi:putative aminopeptidase FrvX